MITLEPIKPFQLDAMWDMFAPFLQMAIDESHGELTLGGIRHKVMNKTLLLVGVIQDDELIAAVTYEQRTLETGKRIVFIHTAGGDSGMEWIEKAEALAVELAKSHDCSGVYIIGRKGWERRLKHLGYGHINTIIGKEVE